MRACRACAAGRRKCSGGLPCIGCQRRELECKYPDETRRRPGKSVLRSTEKTSTSLEQHFNGSPSSPQTGGRNRTTNNMDAANSPSTQQLIDSSVSRMHDNAVSETSQIQEDHSLQNRMPEFQVLLESPWLDASFSSINWLPDYWTPDFGLEGSNDFQPLDPSQFAEPRPQNDPASLLYQHVFIDDVTTIQQQQQSPTRSYANQPRSETEHRNEISTPSSTSTRSAGQYYVDGDGARLPRVKDLGDSLEDEVQIIVRDHGNSDTAFNFTQGAETDLSLQDTDQIPMDVYETMSSMFEATCVSSRLFPKFSNTYFPSQKVFEYCLKLYFDSFQELLPFIHLPTFDMEAAHWLLILALCSIGSNYLDPHSYGSCSQPMHEFLRRTINTVENGSGDLKILSLHHLSFDFNDSTIKLLLTQVKLINSVGMLYSDNKFLVEQAKATRLNLISFCITESPRLISLTTNDVIDSENFEDKWKFWIQGETHKRVWYSIWVNLILIFGAKLMIFSFSTLCGSISLGCVPCFV